MIYVVMAAVFGFAGWQIYRFVRRLRTSDCSTGDCPACSVQDYCKGRKDIKKEGHQSFSD